MYIVREYGVCPIKSSAKTTNKFLFVLSKKTCSSKPINPIDIPKGRVLSAKRLNMPGIVAEGAELLAKMRKVFN